MSEAWSRPTTRPSLGEQAGPAPQSEIVQSKITLAVAQTANSRQLPIPSAIPIPQPQLMFLYGSQRRLLFGTTSRPQNRWRCSFRKFDACRQAQIAVAAAI
jgi:hypothetical protein